MSGDFVLGSLFWFCLSELVGKAEREGIGLLDYRIWIMVSVMDYCASSWVWNAPL